MIKIVPLVLNAFQNLDKSIADNAPALRRLAVKLGGLKLLCLLVKSSTQDAFADELWNSASRLDLLERAPEPYLTGKMLMDLGVKPGKQMGEIIKQSFELQLDGKITSQADAVAWARDCIASIT